ncbi:MAG: hypothetical protein BGP05_14295 [Rhizobiales bacterium 62-47]|nr:MAG: hypothetical protein BGP05_14295 [Rhizobiales bacterium 62-47]
MNARALRYKQLAFKSTDAKTAQLLRMLADEAERGVLVTTDRLKVKPPTPTIEQGRPAGSNCTSLADWSRFGLT